MGPHKLVTRFVVIQHEYIGNKRFSFELVLLKVEMALFIVPRALRDRK